MTFRDPERIRWDFALTCLWCVVIVLGGTLAPGRFASPLTRQIVFAGFVAGAGGFMTYRVWLLVTTYVIVDDRGVRWRKGHVRGSLQWEQIAGMECVPLAGMSKWGLVERPGGTLHPLPLMPRGLFTLLKEKCGGVPPGTEERLLR
jgi:hypothetical protein